MNIVAIKPGFHVSRVAGVPRRNKRRCIVLHATAGSSVGGAVTTLRTKKLGYHYLIAKDGTVYKGAATQHVVGHAGTSRGPLGEGANGYSIGVSFVNLNNGHDPYTFEQERSLQWLINELCRACPTIKWVTTHRAISLMLSGKTDPKKFNFKALTLPDGVEWWDGNGWGLV